MVRHGLLCRRNLVKWGQNRLSRKFPFAKVSGAPRRPAITTITCSLCMITEGRAAQRCLLVTKEIIRTPFFIPRLALPQFTLVTKFLEPMVHQYSCCTHDTSQLPPPSPAYSNHPLRLVTTILRTQQLVVVVKPDLLLVSTDLRTAGEKGRRRNDRHPSHHHRKSRG